jgi:hypothetical protein
VTEEGANGEATKTNIRAESSGMNKVFHLGGRGGGGEGRGGRKGGGREGGREEGRKGRKEQYFSATIAKADLDTDHLPTAPCWLFLRCNRQ